MIFNRIVGSFRNLARLLFYGVKLVYCAQAVIILTIFVYFGIVFVIRFLCFKLSFALLLNSVEGSWVNFSLVLKLSLHGHQSALSILGWLIKRFNGLFFLIISSLHDWVKLQIAIPCMLQFFCMNFIVKLFNFSLILLVPLQSFSVQSMVMILSFLSSVSSFFLNRSKLILFIKTIIFLMF